MVAAWCVKILSEPKEFIKIFFVPVLNCAFEYCFRQVMLVHLLQFLVYQVVSYAQCQRLCQRLMWSFHFFGVPPPPSTVNCFC